MNIIKSTLLILLFVPSLYANTDAFKEIEQAALQGDIEAQDYLGHKYYKEKDYAKTIEWLEKAMLQNYPPAMLSLSYMYQNGIGVSKDSNKANELYKKAMELGGVNATDYWTVDELSTKMVEHHAESGDLKAQLHLLNFYSMRQDDLQCEQRFKWASLALKHDSIQAQVTLAVMYEDGYCIKQDYKKAFELYEKLVAKNHKVSHYRLATLYYKGLGTPQNYQKAMELYKENGMTGHAFALFLVGEMYRKGEGIDVDNIQAYAYYIVSDNMGNYRSPIEMEKLSKHMTEQEIDKSKVLANEIIKQLPNDK